MCWKEEEMYVQKVYFKFLVRKITKYISPILKKGLNFTKR